MARDEVINFKNDPLEVSRKYVGELNSLRPDWKNTVDLAAQSAIFQENLESESSMLYALTELRYATKGSVLVPTITTMLNEGQIKIPEKWKENEVEITRSMLRQAARMDRGDLEAINIARSRGRRIEQSEELNALNKYIEELEEESSPSELPIT